VIAAEPMAAARSAGLRYMMDDLPGIQRVKGRGGFRYLDPHGKPIADRSEIARIRSLAIPPAYSDVWIAPIPNAHLQATGRDARGRKQYRYHKRWREVRDETKFHRMLGFAKALPQIRAAVRRDLAKPGLPREKVLAAVVSLLEATMIRVGNEEYARANDSYGLTTLQEEHVNVRGATIRFAFRGKSGKEHRVTLQDKRLAKIVRACQDLPGHELFHYLDEQDDPVAIHSHDVNEYIREIAGDDFSAKDFRTWEGTIACALQLAAARVESAGEAKSAVVAAIKSVAERLGNTPAVCRKAYIHPAVIDEFLANGGLALGTLRRRSGTGGIGEHEARVIRFLERISRRDERAHLRSLLRKSLRARTSARSPRRTSPRGRRVRES
jgi:DNA topoisomerase I